MGLNEDPKTVPGRIASMRDVDLKQWLFYWNLYNTVREQLGPSGVSALERGLDDYGRWRGNRIRNSPGVVVSDISIGSFLAGWDGTDLLLAAYDRRAEAHETGGETTLRLDPAPGLYYFDERGIDGGHEALARYWTHVLPAMMKEFWQSEGSPGVVEASDGRLVVRWPGGSGMQGEDGDTVLMRRLYEPSDAVTVTRMMSQNAGALYLFIARAVIRALDATGELTVREAVRRIGRERGEALRRKHEAASLPLNMKTLMNDWDGPLVSVWQFAGDGYLSESTWHQDCTWCPYADVWLSFGHEGMALGELYDVELHTSMYNAYLPGVQIEWDTLKTRGDETCGFRFSIPALRREGEPVSRRGKGLLG